MRRTPFLLLLIACGLLATMLVVFHPAAEEVEEGEPSTVSEAELKSYIAVYTAMQDNHDLVIENAIKPYHISLEDFRQLEQRIQSQPRLVERVREALLEDRRTHSIFAESAATPTPAITPPVLKKTPPPPKNKSPSRKQK
jgi:PHD/YefM family antitoxin component YafN of YafNO toxin-antitoxin module